MTKSEEEVIQWAFNLADSIVAGVSNIPTPMVYAINKLQDAAWDVAKERGTTPSKLVSAEYKKVHDDYWADVERKIRELGRKNG